jgi:hypothetical protein
MGLSVMLTNNLKPNTSWQETKSAWMSEEKLINHPHVRSSARLRCCPLPTLKGTGAAFIAGVTECAAMADSYSKVERSLPIHRVYQVAMLMLPWGIILVVFSNH